MRTVAMCMIAVCVIGWMCRGGEREEIGERVGGNSHKVVVQVPVYMEFDYENEGYRVMEISGVRVTAYNNHVNQTNNQPNIGASNRKVYEGSIALSRDILRNYKVRYGDVACVDRMKQCFIVEDTMNKRYDGENGKRADIFLYSKDKALKINLLSTLRVFSQNKK